VTQFRPISPDDGRAVFDVFYDAIGEIDRRNEDPNAWVADDKAMRVEAWAGWRSLFEHVAVTSDLGWLAEAEGGEVVGYARSIRRGDDRELTEFFVRPGHQGAGLGRELLARAFPRETGVSRSIIATLEPGALGRYLRTGLGIHGMIGFLGGRPSESGLTPDAGLRVEAMTGSPDETEAIGALDEATLGRRREVDHGWLRLTRNGLCYRRGDRLVGYGYVGRDSGRCGPFLAADAADLIPMLADAEARAVRAGVESVGFWVPLSNVTAVQHLLGRGYRLDRFLAALFADRPIDGLDRYVVTSPPFFV
jgi:GNAT superfamily N-acetyltransferase